MNSAILPYAERYHASLLHDVLYFWEKYSIDREKGGYFSCLDEVGQVYDTDKFTWLQARQVWTFSKLYNELSQNEAWLEIAGSGSVFLEGFAFDENGDCYFALDREGNPLVQPYNIFSDCFVTMAFAQYGLAAGDQYYMEHAKRLFSRILERKENPKGIYNKVIHQHRPLKGFALPMILSNLVLELEHVLSEDQVQDTIAQCVTEITQHFLCAESGLIFENVLLDGSKHDSFEGRLINPGHGIEACWFLMDIAQKMGDTELMEKMVSTSLSLIEYGWDERYEGIFYFLDVKGHPPQQLEWDQKLWWVHLEALIALVKGFKYTGDPRCWQWFEKLDEYTWSHFRDPRGGLEWYGYLNRQGEVLLPLKGGKWKGCYHVPRALHILSSELKAMSEQG